MFTVIFIIWFWILNNLYRALKFYTTFLLTLTPNANGNSGQSIILKNNYKEEVLSKSASLSFSKGIAISSAFTNYKNSMLNVAKVSYFTISTKLASYIENTWLTKFAPSSFLKYTSALALDKLSILYLRKNKVFNKGRYSRNRQYYRTGVYWCLYVNIIAVIGIYFWFYRFTINFGYLWWLLYAFMVSLILPKSLKYRFNNVLTLVDTFIKNIFWFALVLVNSIKAIFAAINWFKARVLASYFAVDFFNLTSKNFIEINFILGLNAISVCIANLFNASSLNGYYLWENTLIQTSNFSSQSIGGYFWFIGK